jgi:hypothetical protein
MRDVVECFGRAGSLGWEPWVVLQRMSLKVTGFVGSERWDPLVLPIYSVVSVLTEINCVSYFCLKRNEHLQLQPTMNYLVATYITYLAISISLTVWVAKTLHRNGRQFLVDSFHGNNALADSVNHLLIVGFYLINIGYIALALKFSATAANLQELIEAVSIKVGAVMVILGGMHFLNIFVFARWRRRAMTPTPPPILPPTYLRDVKA